MTTENLEQLQTQTSTNNNYNYNNNHKNQTVGVTPAEESIGNRPESPQIIFDDENGNETQLANNSYNTNGNNMHTTENKVEKDENIEMMSGIDGSNNDMTSHQLPQNALAGTGPGTANTTNAVSTPSSNEEEEEPELSFFQQKMGSANNGNNNEKIAKKDEKQCKNKQKKRKKKRNSASTSSKRNVANAVSFGKGSKASHAMKKSLSTLTGLGDIINALSRQDSRSLKKRKKSNKNAKNDNDPNAPSLELICEVKQIKKYQAYKELVSKFILEYENIDIRDDLWPWYENYKFSNNKKAIEEYIKILHDFSESRLIDSYRSIRNQQKQTSSSFVDPTNENLNDIIEHYEYEYEYIRYLRKFAAMFMLNEHQIVRGLLFLQRVLLRNRNSYKQMQAAEEEMKQRKEAMKRNSRRISMRYIKSAEDEESANETLKSLMVVRNINNMVPLDHDRSLVNTSISKSKCGRKGSNETSGNSSCNVKQTDYIVTEEDRNHIQNELFLNKKVSHFLLTNYVANSTKMAGNSNINSNNSNSNDNEIGINFYGIAAAKFAKIIESPKYAKDTEFGVEDEKNNDEKDGILGFLQFWTYLPPWYTIDHDLLLLELALMHLIDVEKFVYTMKNNRFYENWLEHVEGGRLFQEWCQNKFNILHRLRYLLYIIIHHNEPDSVVFMNKLMHESHVNYTRRLMEKLGFNINTNKKNINHNNEIYHKEADYIEIDIDSNEMHRTDSKSNFLATNSDNRNAGKHSTLKMASSLSDISSRSLHSLPETTMLPRNGSTDSFLSDVKFDDENDGLISSGISDSYSNMPVRDIEMEFRDIVRLFEPQKFGKKIWQYIMQQLQHKQRQSLWRALIILAEELPSKTLVNLIEQDRVSIRMGKLEEIERLCRVIVKGSNYPMAMALHISRFLEENANHDLARYEEWNHLGLLQLHLCSFHLFFCFFCLVWFIIVCGQKKKVFGTYIKL